MAETDSGDMKSPDMPDTDHHLSESAGVEPKSNQKSSEIPMFCYDVKPEMTHGTAMNSLGDMTEFGARIMIDEANKLYVCHLCDFRTAFRNSLLNHQAVHSDSRPWVCNMCEYAAKRKQDLKKHLHTIHGMMVDSTMLKPVLDPQTAHQFKGEGSEDNSSDGSNVNSRNQVGDSEGAPFLAQSAGDGMSLPSLRSPGHADAMHNFVKQELSSPGSSHFLPRTTSESDAKSPDDSPDDDLPISFPAVPPATGIYDNQSMDNDRNMLPQTYAGPGPAAIPKYKEVKAMHNATAAPNQHFSPPAMPNTQMHHLRPPFNHNFPSLPSPYSYPPQIRKRFQYNNIPTPEGPHGYVGRTGPSQAKRARSPDKDDGLCSSSAGNAPSRGSQTHTAFMCEHCNIMFFQRAMYLMHMGLHSSHDPWQCTVCGGSFTEVYSFTSHFINQH